MVFEKLKERLILQGTIEVVTPLHIGSGKGEREIGEVDLPILRDPSGRPYIPGSSLKGKTRSEAERIANQEGQEVCNPPDVKNMCGTLKTGQIFCICCRIFGTAGTSEGESVASKVKFRDAYPLEKIDTSLTRIGIAMDRERGSVAPGALYSIDAIPAGTRLDIEIVTENLSIDEAKMLKAALKSVQDSALGGSTSRGLGKIQFNFTKLLKRTARFYLGEEKEEVLEGDTLANWLKSDLTT